VGKFAPWNNDSTLILAILWEGREHPCPCGSRARYHGRHAKTLESALDLIYLKRPRDRDLRLELFFDNVAKNRRGPGTRASGSSEPTGKWHTAGSGAGAPNFGAGVLPERCKEFWPVAFSLSTRR
jgi:hypothetical protein